MEEFMNIVHTLQLLDCACHTQGCKDQFTTMFYWPIINFINGKISEESANTSCVKEWTWQLFFFFFLKICRNKHFLVTAFNASVTTSESFQCLCDNIYQWHIWITTRFKTAVCKKLLRNCTWHFSFLTWAAVLILLWVMVFTKCMHSRCKWKYLQSSDSNISSQR